MSPLLRAGDLVLVDPAAYRARAPAQGEIVVASDPRSPDRLLIKRVGSIDPVGWLVLSGDHADGSTDSRAFGPVDPASVRGQAWARYWPPGRVGLLR
jgi:nickel-type superoxide dismutase maturation protease